MFILSLHHTHLFLLSPYVAFFILFLYGLVMTDEGRQPGCLIKAQKQPFSFLLNSSLFFASFSSFVAQCVNNFKFFIYLYYFLNIFTYYYNRHDSLGHCSASNGTRVQKSYVFLSFSFAFLCLLNTQFLSLCLTKPSFQKCLFVHIL